MPAVKIFVKACMAKRARLLKDCTLLFGNAFCQ
jgi:hypothetical protein